MLEDHSTSMPVNKTTTETHVGVPATAYQRTPPAPLLTFMVYRNILVAATAFVLMNLSSVFEDFGRGYILAKIDKDDPNILAASAYISTVDLFLMTTAMSVLFAMASIVGRKYGETQAKKYDYHASEDEKNNFIAQKRDEMGSVLQQGAVLGLAVSAPVLGVMASIGPILKTLGQPSVQADITNDFFKGFMPAVPAMMLNAAIRQFLLSINHRKFVLATNVLALSVSLPLGWVLSNGSLGFPNYGVQGIAWAITIRSWLNLFANFTYLALEKECKTYMPLKPRGFQFKQLKYIASEGFPIAVQIGGEISSLVVNQMFIGRLGVVSLAAQNVTAQYLSLFQTASISFLEATTIFVAQERGKNQFNEMRRYGNAGIVSGAAAAALVFVGASAAAEPLTKFFLSPQEQNYQEVLALGIILIRITSGSQILDALKQISAGASRGILDNTVPMLMSLGALWLVGLPSGLSLAFPAHLGVKGLAIGHGIGLLINATGQLYRWNSKSNHAIASGQVDEGIKLTDLFRYKKCRESNTGEKRCLLNGDQNDTLPINASGQSVRNPSW